MTKAITCQMFETTVGTLLVADEQSVIWEVGEIISHKGKRFVIESIVPPTQPEGKWSLKVRSFNSTVKVK